jgi:uncharacterized delta-60 repeat protein
MEMAMKKLFMLLAAVLIMVITGCGGGGGSDSTAVSLSSAKAITGFSLNDCFGIINETDKTIAVSMPHGTDLTALVATFTTTGASVAVDSIPQTSETTPINFTGLVKTYTVTAADATTQNYTVTVTVSSSTSGFLDTASFGTAGTGGKVTTTIGNIDYKIIALGIQPSTQKIVVAGSSYNGTKYNFALVRYNTDGSLDTGFGAAGTNGIVTTSIGSVDDEAYGLVIQSDDTILVAGSSHNGTDYDFALVKYTKDGIPDTTFGTAGTGIVTTPIGSGQDYAYSLGIQYDGSIVVAGSSYNGTKYNFALVRYTKEGILDTTFGAAGTNGKVITPVGSYYDYANALVIQSDDTILVAGRSSINEESTKYKFALVKYTKDGIPDATFGTAGTGIVTTTIGNIYDEAHALGIQPSTQKIVVAGSSYNGTKYNFALVRYNTDGSLDTGFGADNTGIVTTPIGSNYAFAYALGIQSDESIVAAGFSNNSSNYDFALVKYTKDGNIDTTFGTGGIATTPIGSSDDFAYALGIQSDKKIVVAGTFYNISSSKYDFALARYLP